MGLVPNLRQHYTTTLALSSSLLTLSSANYAFDNQAFSQTLALPHFVRTFGNCKPAVNGKPGKCALDSVWLSLFQSCLYITFSLGLIIGTTFQAKYGRKKTIRYMCLIPLVSASIMVSARNRWQLLAGRMVHYLYAGVELGCIPVYQAELVPAQVRGFAVGSYQMSYGLGNLCMNLIIKGTSYIDSDAQWLIPYGLFYLIPIIVGIGSFWLPESPRWLIQQGRIEEAAEILRRIRKNPTEESIAAEINQTVIILESNKEKGRWVDMLLGANRRRTLIVIGMQVFTQITGQNFASQYGAVFIKSIGTVNPQTMGIMSAIAAFSSTTLALLVADRWGRRKIFVTGAIWQAGVLFIMAGSGMAQPVTFSLKALISSMVPLYQLGFGFGSSSVQHVIVAEVPHQTLRDKSQQVAGVVNSIMAFTVSFTLPYLLNAPYANLGPKVGFIFGPMAILSLLWGYFCMPECRGRTLEEVNLLFYHGVPARKSAAWQPPMEVDKDLENFAHRGEEEAPALPMDHSGKDKAEVAEMEEYSKP